MCLRAADGLDGPLHWTCLTCGMSICRCIKADYGRPFFEEAVVDGQKELNRIRSQQQDAREFRRRYRMRIVLDLEKIISNATLAAHNDQLRSVEGASVSGYVHTDVVAALANHGVEIVAPEPAPADTEPEAKTAVEAAMDRSPLLDAAAGRL